MGETGDAGWLGRPAGGGLGKTKGGGEQSCGETFSNGCAVKYESARRRFDGVAWKRDSLHPANIELLPLTVLHAVVDPRRLLETD